MARPGWRARPIGFAALITLLGLTGCTYYGDPRYGGYDYGGVGPNYDYPYEGYDYRYGQPYGYRYDQPHYGYPYRYPYRGRGDYCYYHRCDWDDDD